MHPGTEIAKSFISEISLIEHKTSRRVLIEMNAPLRHKGYTLVLINAFHLSYILI